MFTFISNFFGNPKSMVAVNRPCPASNTLKCYDVMKTKEERGAFIVQTRPVTVDRIDAQNVEQATRVARQNYGEGAYVVLVIGD